MQKLLNVNNQSFFMLGLRKCCYTIVNFEHLIPAGIAKTSCVSILIF